MSYAFNYLSSIGRVFRSPLRRRRKMAALPLPVAILDDLIPSFGNEVIQDGDRKRKGRHLAPPPQWGSKNPPQVLDDVISGVAILDPRWRRWKWRLEDVETPVKTFYRRLPPSMSPVEVWLYWKHLIVSLTQALSKWLSELPACYYAEVISLHMSKVMKNLRLQQAPTLLFFF